MQVVMAVAVLTVFGDWSFAPDLHACGRTGSCRLVYLWVGGWWRSAYWRAPAGLAFLDLVRGAAEPPRYAVAGGC